MTEKEIRQKFVNMAVSYLGTKEGSEKHKFIVDTYNRIVPLPVNYIVKYSDAWCATFVSFVAAQCDLLDIVPAECGCQRQIELWKKLGRWEENDAYVPAMGDILYFDWDDNGVGNNTGHSDHVGIVVSVTGNQIKVIEGNKNNAVEYRTISVNNKFIRGWGKPNFASKATKEPVKVTPTKPVKKNTNVAIELPTLKQGDKGDSVKALQVLLIGYGHSCGKSGADGVFGADTYKAVKAYQKRMYTTQDGIVGKNTWSRLLGNTIFK